MTDASLAEGDFFSCCRDANVSNRLDEYNVPHLGGGRFAGCKLGEASDYACRAIAMYTANNQAGIENEPTPN